LEDLISPVVLPVGKHRLPTDKRQLGTNKLSQRRISQKISRDSKDPENNWKIPCDSTWDQEADQVFHGLWRFIVE
jgi:hypothetical protein